MKRWKQRPPGSNWGDFGDDDQLGRMNLLTPQKVLAAVGEVRAGRSFCLSLPLDLPGGSVLDPRRHPPRRFATVRGGVAEPVYHNGFRAGVDIVAPEFRRGIVDWCCSEGVEAKSSASRRWPRRVCRDGA